VISNDTPTLAPPPATAPDPALGRLGRLVGAWRLVGRESGPNGEILRRLTFEWGAGGRFLVQRVDIDDIGRRVTGIEIIGRASAPDADAPSRGVVSRFYDNAGNALTYVYDVGDDALTIWGGYVGSPANFTGWFGDDGNRITGRWVWPGGRYEATLTRIG
jgi:hypothetical protein